MRDPLTNPGMLIRRIYAYVAFRIGDGHDAEDVTSATIERALRYRSSFDARKGDPVSWVIGIARGCVADHLRLRVATAQLDSDLADASNVEAEVLRRLTVAAAVATLDEREQELIALRYGADLSTREIARLLDMQRNAVDVALHRTRERLRPALAQLLDEAASRNGRSVVARPAPGTSS